MSTLVGATEAARILSVSKPTLYAYVSRGTVSRTVAVDGRTSLYVREQLEELAASRNRRAVVDRPSIDVQIGSAITELDDRGVRYRGFDAVELSHNHSFEEVAEMLWSGDLPTGVPSWRPERGDLDRCRAVVAAARVSDPIAKLTVSLAALDDTSASATPIARRLLAVAPSVLGGPLRGSTAQRLAKAWRTRPDDAIIAAVDRALVLLADHELATSTLAVRVAASVRTTPAAALSCGLATVGGRLHGRAAEGAVAMMRRAVETDPPSAVAERLAGGGRLPGFGHSLYKAGDPRFSPLMDAVRGLSDEDGVLDTIDAVLAEAGRRTDRLPNVDFALAALHLVGGLADDAPLFAVARIAGWAAHHDEELGERPVRFRGMARAR